MEKACDFRKTFSRRNGSLSITALLFLSTFFLSTSVEARGVEFEDIYPDYKTFLPKPSGEEVQLSFMNRTTFAAKKPFPTLNGPPQCPYDTLKRGLKVPMLGKVDLRLFCVPKEQTDKSPEVKVKESP